MAKIPEEVLNILGECRTEGSVLFLPNVQLDRKLYTAVNKVLENMGGKWNRKAKGHVFDNGDPAEILEAVLLTHEVRDLKKEYQFFPTPALVAERMCDLAEIGPSSDVLEPSCGDGRLADVIWERNPGSMTCIELNRGMEKYLKDKPYTVNFIDFLELTKERIGHVDRVVMNPPFAKSQDIDHIHHAYDLLDHGGILVSVVCEGPFFRSNKKAVEFRDFLAEAADTFRESGTGVLTRLVKIRKAK